MTRLDHEKANRRQAATVGSRIRLTSRFTTRCGACNTTIHVGQPFFHAHGCRPLCCNCHQDNHR